MSLAASVVGLILQSGRRVFLKIVDLRTNYITNPIGYDLSYQTLTWKYEAQAEEAPVKRWQVDVAKDIEFKSLISRIQEQENLNSKCELMLELEPRTRYYWRITVWCEDNKQISEMAYFETGKLNEKWSGGWIGIKRNSAEVSPVIRKTFCVEKKVQQARIYMTGLGLYECYMNDIMVNDGYLQPGFHNYNFWIQYQSYDVTETIKKGVNTLGFLLGAGWYKGRFGVNGGFENNFGENYHLLCELHIQYSDGTETVINSDDSFVYSDGPVLFSNIYDGEIFDAGKLEINWMDGEYNTESWKKVQLQTPERMEKLVERYSVPIKKKDVLIPEKIIHTPAGKTVIDFGQNITGWLVIRGSMAANQTIKFLFAEHMQKGEICRDNLGTAKQEFVYTGNGEENLIRPHFTYFGFRYVQVEEMELADEYILEHIEGWNLYSDLPMTGSIVTGNKDVNQLISNALWSQKDNFTDHPTDCPQRAERLGWTGDAQFYSGTASMFMYTPAFFRKYMKDVNEEQRHKNGQVPFIVPKIAGRGMEAQGDEVSAAWSDVATVIPWILYELYGDKNLLAEEYEGMKAWVEYMIEKDREGGNKSLWQSGFHFGDWLSLDNIQPGPFGKTEPFYIASCYYYYSTKLTAKAAKVIGNKEDEIYYRGLAEKIRQAIRLEYFNENGVCMQDTQTGYVLAIFMDIAEGGEIQENGQFLVEKIQEAGGHLDTGFVGTPYICRALSKAGYNETAYQLLLREEYPSWLYPVKLGATTIWESWNALNENGEFILTPSLNHYTFGSVVEWIFRDVCGLNPCWENDKAVMRIQPKPSKQLGSASGRLETLQGCYEVTWRIVEDKIDYEIKIPYSGRAKFTSYYNGEELELTPGIYQYSEKVTNKK